MNFDVYVTLLQLFVKVLIKTICYCDNISIPSITFDRIYFWSIDEIKSQRTHNFRIPSNNTLMARQSSSLQLRMRWRIEVSPPNEPEPNHLFAGTNGKNPDTAKIALVKPVPRAIGETEAGSHGTARFRRPGAAAG